MKKITLFLAALCCTTLLQAKTTISKVNLTLNLDSIEYYMGNTEGQVNTKIQAFSTATGDGLTTYNKANSGLRIKHGDCNYWGIGYGEEAIDTIKTYAVLFNLEYDTANYVLPADLADIEVTYNGVAVTPDCAKIWNYHMFAVYILLGKPAEAPKATYTLSLVNTDKYRYPGQTYTGGDYFEGAEVTFQAKTFRGKEFNKWVATGLVLTEEQQDTNILAIVMPANAVTIEATYTDVKYAVTVAATEHGTVEVDKDSAIYHDEVTLTITPDAGYELDKVTVMGDFEISVIDNKFTMQDYDVTVTAAFKEKTPTAIDEMRMSETKAQKVMVDGVIYILRGDKVYNLQGIECEIPQK